jgi:hypothetical protein
MEPIISASEGVGGVEARGMMSCYPWEAVITIYLIDIIRLICYGSVLLLGYFMDPWFCLLYTSPSPRDH